MSNFFSYFANDWFCLFVGNSVVLLMAMVVAIGILVCATYRVRSVLRGRDEALRSSIMLEVNSQSIAHATEFHNSVQASRLELSRVIGVEVSEHRDAHLRRVEARVGEMSQAMDERFLDESRRLEREGSSRIRRLEELEGQISADLSSLKERTNKVLGNCTARTAEVELAAKDGTLAVKEAANTLAQLAADAEEVARDSRAALLAIKQALGDARAAATETRKVLGQARAVAGDVTTTQGETVRLQLEAKRLHAVADQLVNALNAVLAEAVKEAKEAKEAKAKEAKARATKAAETRRVRDERKATREAAEAAKNGHP